MSCPATARGPRFHRGRPGGSGCAGVLLGALLAGGCSCFIEPPAALSQPVHVFLADHGLHGSLLLRDGEELVEFAYGEEQWFARNEKQWWRVFPALLWPTTGALGTRRVPASSDPAEIAARIGALEVLALEVEAADQQALLAELRGAFALPADQLIPNREAGLDFVIHPDDYWLGNSCNSALADWLTQLQCEVFNAVLWADFTVEAPAAVAPE